MWGLRGAIAVKRYSIISRHHLIRCVAMNILRTGRGQRRAAAQKHIEKLCTRWLWRKLDAGKTLPV